jgi:hypothetical protein
MGVGWLLGTGTGVGADIGKVVGTVGLVQDCASALTLPVAACGFAGTTGTERGVSCFGCSTGLTGSTDGAGPNPGGYAWEEVAAGALDLGAVGIGVGAGEAGMGAVSVGFAARVSIFPVGPKPGGYIASADGLAGAALGFETGAGLGRDGAGCDATGFCGTDGVGEV